MMSNYRLFIKKRREDNSIVTWEDIINISLIIRDGAGFDTPMVSINDVDVLNSESESTDLYIELTIYNTTIKHASRKFVESIEYIRNEFDTEVKVITL